MANVRIDQCDVASLKPPSEYTAHVRHKILRIWKVCIIYTYHTNLQDCPKQIASFACYQKWHFMQFWKRQLGTRCHVWGPTDFRGGHQITLSLDFLSYQFA